MQYTTFNYSNINSINDLYEYTNLIKKGVFKMPNISRLSRQLNRDRKTIKNALNGKIPKKTRNKTKYLDAFKDIIESLLNDKCRQFDYYQHLFNYMKREYNISCSYSTFRQYIKNDINLSKCFKISKNNIFTERFETKPGEQAQFDFKERVPVYDVNGNKIKVNIAVLTLGYSRYNFRSIVPDTSLDSVIKFLSEVFNELEGVPKEIVIDNFKAAVDKPRTKNSNAIINSKFLEFAKDYGFKILPCMPCRPQTKGKVESQNKIINQIKNYGGSYRDFNDIGNIIDMITIEDNENISQATGFPATLLLKNEKKSLNPLPNKKIRQTYYKYESEVSVSNESLISHNSCKYSVPKEYINKKVYKIVKNNYLYLYYNTKLITVHQISNKKINIKDIHNLKYENNINTKNQNNLIIKDLLGVVYDN